MKTAHTPEPWSYQVSEGFLSGQSTQPFLWGWDDQSLAGDNASNDISRIITCVNALAGIDDPAAAIAAAREALESAKGFFAAFSFHMPQVDTALQLLTPITKQ